MTLFHRHPLYRLGLPLVTAIVTALSLGGCGNQTITPYEPGSPSSPSDKTLKLLYWQAPTNLNPHLSPGLKDMEANHLVLEPLAAYDENATLEPVLAATIPSLDNGDLDPKGNWVIWRLQPGTTWSDGEPLTAADLVFTHEFVTNPDTGATSTEFYSDIDTIEAVDDLTVKITFKKPTAVWMQPFVGMSGLILPQHIYQDWIGEKARSAPANNQPIGTGPYRVVEFRPGDVVIYEPNPNYRGTTPYFERVELKGGGDAVSAARAVLQTGEADYAWNIQVEPAILNELLGSNQGQVYYNFQPMMERLVFNFSDPNQEKDGQRSHRDIPHPILSDRAVREAISLAVDRQTIVDQLYGPAGQVAQNFIVAPDRYSSPNTRYQFNLEKAARVLDLAGWVDSNNNGIRDKNGVEMQLVFQTSTNPVRQKTQELIKQNLELLGMDIELKAIESSVYFGDSTNPDSVYAFNADLQMFAYNSETPEPDAYMNLYACDQISQQENQWAKENLSRYCNPEYDRLLAQLNTSLDPEERRSLFIQLNDLLIQDYALVPLVHRSDAVVVSNALANLRFSPWNPSTWKLGAWTRVEK